MVAICLCSKKAQKIHQRRCHKKIKARLIGSTSSPTFVGFFVYRHLGLLECNIVLMVQLLPLFMLTGLLFGQDVLNRKSGE